jgi:hypothetical protein
VKTLVDYQARMLNIEKRDTFPYPVAGSVNDHAPTSGDVHLYSDPGTYYSQTPMLYADCEGMNGGEKIPIGAMFKHIDFAPPRQSIKSNLMISQSTYGLALSRKLQKKLNKPVKRELHWANNPDRCKREFAVRELYPRLLYAFSDIVVFVLRNDRLVIGELTNPPTKQKPAADFQQNFRVSCALTHAAMGSLFRRRISKSRCITARYYCPQLHRSKYTS